MSDLLNRYNNRLNLAEADGTAGRLGLNKSDTISTSFNQFVEVTGATPDYSIRQRLAIAVVDPVVSNVVAWDLDGYRSLHGYPVFTGAGAGESVTLQLWGVDEQNGNDYLIATAVASHLAEFNFENQVRNRRVRLVVSGLVLGGYNNVGLFTSAE